MNFTRESVKSLGSVPVLAYYPQYKGNPKMQAATGELIPLILMAETLNQFTKQDAYGLHPRMPHITPEMKVPRHMQEALNLLGIELGPFADDAYTLTDMSRALDLAIAQSAQRFFHTATGLDPADEILVLFYDRVTSMQQISSARVWNGRVTLEFAHAADLRRTGIRGSRHSTDWLMSDSPSYLLPGAKFPTPKSRQELLKEYRALPRAHPD